MTRVARRVGAFAVACVLGVGAWASTPTAGAAPLVPAPPVVALVDDSASRAARLDVTWTGSVDATGGYVVEHARDGGDYVASVVGIATSYRIEAVERGVSWRVRIRAVDQLGARSEPSTDTSLAVPPLAARVGASVRLSPSAVRACPGARAVCTLASVRGLGFELRAAPSAALAGAVVELEVLHRRPGARSFRLQSRRRLTLADGEVAARMPLSQLVRRAGTWCVRRRLLDAPDLDAGTPIPTCVRLRPPVELGWAGDIVIGSHYGLPPNGGRDQFARVARLLRDPDLMIGNYEGTLSRGGRPRCSGGPRCFIFQAPPERARNLRTAGFDVMNLANNHALDMGEGGRRQTVRALERVGVRASGLPGRVLRVQAQDTIVGIVGMSPYPGSTSMRSPTAIRRLVTDARRGSDVVVVAMHVGLEGAAGAHVPRGADYGTHTRDAAHRAIDAGADVVFGSGPHVVRGIERYRGRYVIYSSGNFAGWRNFGIGGLTAQSGVVRMTFDYLGRPSRGVWDGVVLDGVGIPRPDRSGRVVRRVAALSREDFGRRGARFGAGGRFR